MRKTIAIDLDGVLADYSQGWQGVDRIGDPIPGAQQFVQRLRERYEVVIWTTRTNAELNRQGAHLLRNRIREWLGQWGFEYDDIWTGQGKPPAAAFIDDRAVRCEPHAESSPANAYTQALLEVDRLCQRKAGAERPAEAIPVDMPDCARCGMPHEGESCVDFLPLRRPSGEWTHWATCPNTGEPIFMLQMEFGTEETSRESHGDHTARLQRELAVIAFELALDALTRDREDPKALMAMAYLRRNALMPNAAEAWPQSEREGGAT